MLALAVVSPPVLGVPPALGGLGASLLQRLATLRPRLHLLLSPAPCVRGRVRRRPPQCLEDDACAFDPACAWCGGVLAVPQRPQAQGFSRVSHKTLVARCKHQDTCLETGTIVLKVLASRRDEFSEQMAAGPAAPAIISRPRRLQMHTSQIRQPQRTNGRGGRGGRWGKKGAWHPNWGAAAALGKYTVSTLGKGSLAYVLARNPPIQDISRAEFTWCMTAIDWGWDTRRLPPRLMELSSKTRENGENHALLTAQNAAAAAVRRRGQVAK
jgi:hypothetical protein